MTRPTAKCPACDASAMYIQDGKFVNHGMPWEPLCVASGTDVEEAS